jgi:hypothetical protein
MLQAFSETLTFTQVDAECFQFYVKSLFKKPGDPYVCPISLLNRVVKIMDRLLLLKLLHWIQRHNLVTGL